MDKENKISCRSIRDMDMVVYLEKLGFNASKIRGKDFWYLSPFRNERTPSFKINTRLNRWYDHGIGCGGNLVDFCLRFYNCTVTELLEKFDGNVSFQQPLLSERPLIVEPAKIIVDHKGLLQLPALLAYLRKRKISPDIAAKYCAEVWYTLYEKRCFAIGFQNDAGGYELRSSIAKLSSSPKTFTTIKNGSNSVCIFEGFFDFLSLLMIAGDALPNWDFLILNSAAFFEQALPVCADYKNKYLFLDRDTTGQNCSRQAIALQQSYLDCSNWYRDCTDLNEWLTKATPEDRKQFRRQLSAYGLIAGKNNAPGG